MKEVQKLKVRKEVRKTTEEGLCVGLVESNERRALKGGCLSKISTAFDLGLTSPLPSYRLSVKVKIPTQLCRQWRVAACFSMNHLFITSQHTPSCLMDKVQYWTLLLVQV